jgi:sulfhydrogenase subunit beta (sulfur reductase)
VAPTVAPAAQVGRTSALVGANVPNGGYDLFLTDLGDHFVVHVNTQAGDDIIDAVKFFTPATAAHLEALRSLREKKRPFSQRGRNRPAPLRRFSGDREPGLAGPDACCLACGNC